jgi:hypothetical protein
LEITFGIRRRSLRRVKYITDSRDCRHPSHCAFFVKERSKGAFDRSRNKSPACMKEKSLMTMNGLAGLNGCAPSLD